MTLRIKKSRLQIWEMYLLMTSFRRRRTKVIYSFSSKNHTKTILVSNSTVISQISTLRNYHNQCLTRFLPKNMMISLEMLKDERQMNLKILKHLKLNWNKMFQTILQSTSGRLKSIQKKRSKKLSVFLQVSSHIQKFTSITIKQVNCISVKQKRIQMKRRHLMVGQSSKLLVLTHVNHNSIL